MISIPNSQNRSKIDALANVSINNPIINQILTFNGTNWVNLLIPAQSLSSLSDTSLSSVANGQVLTYNGTKWINLAIPAQSLSSLSDTNISSATNNQVLTYNGTKWINLAIPAQALANLTDVNLAGIPNAQGYVLWWNGTKWIFRLPSIGNNYMSDVLISGIPNTNQSLVYNGTTNQWNPGNIITSGTWTPSITNTNNCSGAVSNTGYWTRIGNMLQCYWHGTVNINASVNNFYFYITLPVLPTANFASYYQLGGTATSNAFASTQIWLGFIQSNGGNTTALVCMRSPTTNASATNNFEVFVNFSYSLV